MSSRQLEIDVLRALYRLSRRRGPARDRFIDPTATLQLLSSRVDSDEGSVRRALFGLAQTGLVQRTPAGLRLSLAGLAVAVSSTKRPRPIVKQDPGVVANTTNVPMTSSKSHRAA
jgi:hypothetical protein